MGATHWPRDKKTKPLVFVAQIDLAEGAAKAGNPPPLSLRAEALGHYDA